MADAKHTDLELTASRDARSLAAASLSRAEELVEDIDEAADELVDSVQYLQEKLNAGDELYESKWIGGVMRAHEMLIKLSAHVKHADAWPCDGEGDEYGNFVCKNRSRLNHAAAAEPPCGAGVNSNPPSDIEELVGRLDLMARATSRDDLESLLDDAVTALRSLASERDQLREAVESAHGQFRDIRMLIPCCNYEETVRKIADRAVVQMHRALVRARSLLPQEGK